MNRREYLGGGDIAAIINASPYTTAIELWDRKINGEPPISAEKAKFFRRRQQMEPVIVRMLEEDHGIVATKVSFNKPNRYRDPKIPLFAAEIDFETVMTPGLAETFPRLANVPTGETINGEIKTSSEWGRHGWGDIEQEQIPNHVAAQVMWGLGVTERPAALVCPLFGIDELPVYPVLADEVVVTWLRNQALEFWELVQNRVMPAPKPGDLADLKRACSRLVGVPVDLDDAAMLALTNVFAARAQVRDLEDMIASDEHRIFEHVRKAWSVPSDPTVDMPADDAVLMHDGQPVAVYPRRTRESVDVKRLRAEDPLTFHKYRRESVYRTLAKPPKGSR